MRVHGVAHGDDAKSLKEGTWQSPSPTAAAAMTAQALACRFALGVLLHPTYDRWYDAMVDQRVPALVVTAIGYGHKRCATTLLHRWQGQMPLGGIGEGLYLLHTTRWRDARSALTWLSAVAPRCWMSANSSCERMAKRMHSSPPSLQ